MKIESAYIEITNQCNLDCHTCYNRSGKNLQRIEFSVAQFQKITKQLVSEFGCKTIFLAGGEPTLHSEFGTILDYLYSIPKLQVGVVTNGTTNCQKLIETYHLHPDMKLQVSLDGACEESNAKTRGSGNYQKAIDFIKATTGPDHSPIMKMVISQNNLNDIQDYFQLAISIGCTPNYSFINGIGNAKDEWDSLKLTARQKLTVLQLLDRLNTKYRINTKLPASTNICPLSKQDAPLAVLVKCDGTVQPCQALYDDAYSLGNLLEDHADKLAARHATLTQLANERLVKNTECSGCIIQHICKRGCLAHAVTQSADPLGNDGECDYRILQLLCYEIPKNHI